MAHVTPSLVVDMDPHLSKTSSGASATSETTALDFKSIFSAGWRVGGGV